VDQNNGGNTTNTILWIVILVLVTFLINGGGDDGVDASLEAPNAEDRLAKTLAPVEQPIRTLNNLCVPEVRDLISDLRTEDDKGNRKRIENEIFDRLDGSLGMLIAKDFEEGEPVGVDLVKYDYVTSVARHQAETFHGISDIFRSWIGDCGEDLTP
jgi:hypothetical protein